MADNAPTNVLTGLPLFAPRAIVWVAEAITSVSGSAELTDTSQQSSPNKLELAVKNVSIKEGSRKFDALNTLGMPGQYLDRKKPELTEATFTLVNLVNLAATGAASTNLSYLLHGAGTAVSTTAFRVQGGDKATDRTSKSILYKVTDGTNFETVLMNNAWVTDREKSLDADGSEELTITAVCLASDTYVEWKK